MQELSTPTSPHKSPIYLLLHGSFSFRMNKFATFYDFGLFFILMASR